MRRSLTRTFSVPTDAVRAGNFAGLARDLRSADHSGYRRCTPFADNQIPAGRIDPIAAAFLQHVPRPTSSAPAPEPDGGRGVDARTIDQFSVRVDHRLANADQLFGAVQHLRRRRAAAVRHQRAAGNARAGFGRTLDHDDPQPVGQPHAASSALAAERAAGRLDDASTADR